MDSAGAVSLVEDIGAENGRLFLSDFPIFVPSVVKTGSGHT
jgi:hypothetical protein